MIGLTTNAWINEMGSTNPMLNMPTINIKLTVRRTL
jgi:hypothetical protein